MTTASSAPVGEFPVIDDEPSMDEALFEVASADNGNSSARFEDYIPSKEMMRGWMSEINEIVG